MAVAPEVTPVGTLILPSVPMLKPAGAPTRLSSTSPAAGGETPLRLSLASTLAVEVLPGATPVKVSSLATSWPLLMLMVTIARPHRLASGAGRQTW
ncbi:hypothetical protein D3C87_574420 [compost metagenome]